MDRRTFIRGAVIAASTPASIGAVSTSIPDMFREWLSLRDADYAGMTDEEQDFRLSRYRDLQNRIIAAEPETPRDVAMMFLVDTDYTGSDFSNEFIDHMERLALS